MRLIQTLLRTLATLAVSIVAACGGGGDPPAPGPNPPAAQAPVITAQPAATAVQAGQAATFSVTATGTAPVAYQWRRGGSAIAGATAASYTLTATLADNGAGFDVVVSNAAGSATSTTAVLTVTAPPPTLAFTQQPAPQSVTAGQSASFTVAATCGGAAVTVFQWQRSNDGGTTYADITGATAATYAFTTTLADNGARLRATALCGGLVATGDAAALTVTAPVAAAPTVCSGANARGWCWTYPTPQGNTLQGLLADSATQAIAVGSGGTLLRSTDGGATWGGVAPLPDMGTNVRDLVSIARVDANRLIAVGAQALLVSSDNGGSWSTASLPAGLLLKDLTLYGVSTRGGRALAAGVLASGQGVLLASANGGAGWVQATSSASAVRDVTFVTDSLVVAVGDGSRVLRSTDGGGTWTEQRLSATASMGLVRVRAFDATTLLGAGPSFGSGGLYRSTDAGASWTPVTPDSASLFQGLDVRPATGVALAVGFDGTVFRSTDRGQTWTRILEQQGRYYLWDVRFLSDTVALAVGDYGTVLRSTDAGLTWQPVNRSRRATDGVDALANDLHFGSASVGLLAGQTGLLRTADGGRSWNSLPDFDGKFLLGAAFADASTAIALKQAEPATSSDDYDLMRSTDGGLSFTAVSRFPARFVRFNGTGIGIAVGRNGAVWRSTDRGRTWTQVRPTNLAEVSLDQVRWADDSTVLAISQRGVLRSTDAGQTWSAATVPAGVFFNGLAFRSSLQGLGVGYDNGNGTYLLRTTDGGATWTATPWSTLAGTAPVLPYALAWADAQTVVVVGGAPFSSGDSTASTLLRSTDGGSTWTREPSPLRGALTAIHFTSATEGVATGQGFGVLRTTTAGAR